MPYSFSLGMTYSTCDSRESSKRRLTAAFLFSYHMAIRGSGDVVAAESIRFRQTKEAGMITNVLNFGLGVSVADFNNDSWPDLYVGNDYYEQDYLYINQKDGTFSEQLSKYFDHVSLSTMGTDAADFDNDGYIDLMTLDMYPEDNYGQKLVAGPDNYDKVSILKNTGFYHQSSRNMLQLNNHGSFFTEIGQYAGVFSTNWSWAPLLCDFDNDGNKDLYITNGYGRNNTHMDFLMLTVDQVIKKQKGEPVMPRMSFIEKIPATVLKNYIFKNNGDLTFNNVTESWGDEIPSLSNGAAYADLDNDGDMDLVVSRINDYAFIYRNNSNKLNPNHFLKIRFDGIGLNKGGIGAKVEVTCNGQTYTQEFMPSRGYMSSMNHELIFGLGKANTVDELKVTWPDLREQLLTAVGIDRTTGRHTGGKGGGAGRIVRPRHTARQLRPGYGHILFRRGSFCDRGYPAHRRPGRRPIRRACADRHWLLRMGRVGQRRRLAAYSQRQG